MIETPLLEIENQTDVPCDYNFQDKLMVLLSNFIISNQGFGSKQAYERWNDLIIKMIC